MLTINARTIPESLQKPSIHFYSKSNRIILTKFRSESGASGVILKQ